MKNFRNKMLSLIDVATIQMNEAANDLMDAINSVDWDGCLMEMSERKNALLAKSESLLAEAKDLFNESKNCLCDLEFDVPFNEERGETIEYTVNDGVLSVVVSLENDDESYTYKKRITIPKGCDETAISMDVDKEKKVAHFLVPRKLSAPKTDETKSIDQGENEDAKEGVKDALSRKLKDTMKKSQERFGGKSSRIEPDCEK